jgi:hypothetical protein
MKCTGSGFTAGARFRDLMRGNRYAGRCAFCKQIVPLVKVRGPAQALFGKMKIHARTPEDTDKGLPEETPK